MIKFYKSHDPDNPHDISDILHQIPNDVSLEKLLEFTEYFIRAIGFSFKGHLDIVEGEDE